MGSRVEALSRRPDHADLAREHEDARSRKIPRDNSNDSNPVWEGNTVYFLSDRNGPVSLFSFDPETEEVKQVIDNHGYDLKTLSAGPGALVYEQFGSLHLYDLASHSEHAIPIAIHGDLPSLVPHLANIAAHDTQNIAVSPTGMRLVAEAHGDIFTLPAEKGDTRNLTRTPGTAERDPSWSPDGKSVAYFSDASGEYQLYIRDQDGLQPPKVIDLGPDPSYFYSPRWSPDSKHIAYSDKHLHIWYVDVAGGKPVKIDTALRGGFGSQVEFSMGSRLAVDRLLARPREPAPRHLFLLTRNSHVYADHRRHEQCRAPGLRSQRQIPLLHRLHRQRPIRRGYRSLVA